ncbi:MAG: hypothetical protein CVU54_09100 [Deltaproteobacteria bacterium HGW-Deltaproteobacteria-12]|jgi:hypothetical protein|nr:MAG: hypothetical protein CVU54_09100 [Deltaproteobacteria bacterium HGW-Deltaproteobacteria-12]
MSPVNIFENISIDPPYKKIYSRLGFKKKTTALTAQQQKETDILIEEALSFIALKGCARRTIITGNENGKVIIDGDLHLDSQKLAGFLSGCREALLLGATAGSNVLEAIAAETKKDNLSAAVVYDATASEMTDAALDWLMAYFNGQLRREGKKLLPRRFSAGYADLELENQSSFHQLLEMHRIGVSISSNFILRPEKSVTAITGISG